MSKKAEEKKNQALVLASNKVAEIEFKLVQVKIVEEQAKKVKQELYDLMTEYGIDKWTTENNVQITKVAGKEDETIETETFNLVKLKEEMPEVYAKYLSKVSQVVKGRKGFLKVTLPKVVDVKKLAESK